MHKYTFNLSKISQYLAQDLGIKSPIGDDNIIPPPEEPEDNNGKNFEPDDNMVKKIVEWAKTKGCQEVGQDIIPIALTLSPNIDVIVKVDPRDATLFRLKGNVIIRFIHELSDQTPQWNNINNSIRGRLLQSSIWNYLGIPYEDGFFYLQNLTFFEFIVVSVLQSCLTSKNNELAFWAYEHADDYMEKIKEEIINKLQNTNIDPQSLQIIKIPKQASGKSFWRGDSLILMSSIPFSFTVNPWKFEKRFNQGAFLSLNPQIQKSIILDIAEKLEIIAEQIGNQKTLKAEVDVVGKSHSATTDRTEEFPEVNEVNFEPDPIVIYYPISEIDSLSKIDTINLEQVLASIPTGLLHIIRENVSVQAVCYNRDDRNTDGQKATVDTRLLVDHIEVENDKIKIIIVPIEQDVDW